MLSGRFMRGLQRTHRGTAPVNQGGRRHAKPPAVGTDVERRRERGQARLRTGHPWVSALSVITNLIPRGLRDGGEGLACPPSPLPVRKVMSDSSASSPASSPGIAHRPRAAATRMDTRSLVRTPLCSPLTQAMQTVRTVGTPPALFPPPPRPSPARPSPLPPQQRPPRAHCPPRPCALVTTPRPCPHPRRRTRPRSRRARRS